MINIWNAIKTKFSLKAKPVIGQDATSELESVGSIAERVFPAEVAELRQSRGQHIDADRTLGPTDWDRECQESGRLNKR